jgi:hypothetical protein
LRVEQRIFHGEAVEEFAVAELREALCDLLLRRDHHHRHGHEAHAFVGPEGSRPRLTLIKQ